MFRLLFLLIIAWQGFPILFRSPDQSQPTGEALEVEVRSPISGQALQGSVPVVASLPLEGVENFEISFAYEGDKRDSWFLIDEASGTRSSSELTMWDTTTLTDGTYSLRLSVMMADGERKTLEVNGLRVRNYSPVETNTPAPPGLEQVEEARESQAPTQTPAALQTATPPAAPDAPADPFASRQTPSPEPVPGNPAQVTYQAVLSSFGIGALAAGAVFLLLGIYRRAQQAMRNRKDSI
jgi:hypothetical protein